MDWQKNTISFYVDGQFVGSQATPSDMNGPMYLLANLATQNDADAAGVPITTKIDYIRAYSKDPGAVAVAQGVVSAPDGHDPGLHGATIAGSPASASTPSVPTPVTVPAPVAPISTLPTPASSPTATSVGSGSDQLIFKISEDAYKGDAQYTIAVDGKQIGSTLTAHASHAAGQSDTITVKGDWATGDHSVSIKFLNDAYDGTASTDRNLYVDSATYNGAAVSGSHFSMMSAGTQTFTVHDHGFV